MEDRWVTSLSEDNWKDDALGYLSMDLKSFYVYPTQGEVKDSDGQVKHRSDLDELFGMSTTSMDFDVVSVEGEPVAETWTFSIGITSYNEIQRSVCTTSNRT
jgi:hypothetical protein